jgi:hypothetical protein
MNKPQKSIHQEDSRASIGGNDAVGGTVEIQIDQFQAAKWLVCIEELNSKRNSTVLEQFHESLGDDYWLARWKREHVLFNFDTSTLPEILSALVSDEAGTNCDSKVVEDMVATLSRCRS